MDASATLVGIAIVLALVWLSLQIRALHDDLIPVIESPIVQAATRL